MLTIQVAMPSPNWTSPSRVVRWSMVTQLWRGCDPGGWNNSLRKTGFLCRVLTLGVKHVSKMCSSNLPGRRRVFRLPFRCRRSSPPWSALSDSIPLGRLVKQYQLDENTVGSPRARSIGSRSVSATIEPLVGPRCCCRPSLLGTNCPVYISLAVAARLVDIDSCKPCKHHRRRFSNPIE